MREKCKVPKSDVAHRSAIASAIRSVRLCCRGRSCFGTCVARLIRAVCFVFALSAQAALEIEWNGPNQVTISGIGQGGDEPPYTVVTNFIGSCTNCSQVTTDELKRYAFSISDAADSAQSDIISMNASIIEATNLLHHTIDDISQFRVQWNLTDKSITNYWHSADNTQSRLVHDKFGDSVQRSREFNIAIGYNNGIYDYANNYVLSPVQDSLMYCEHAQSYGNTAYQRLETVKRVATTLDHIPVCDNNANFPTNSPQSGVAVETLEELLSLVRHIDNDCHVKIAQLDDITNRFSNLEKKYDEYSRLVSDALYQPNGTIRLAQGDTWETVYDLGEATLYDYNKSNVLQRIELLLYGLVKTNANIDVSGVTGDDTDPEDKKDDLQDALDTSAGDIETSLGDAETTFRDVVRKWQLCLSKFSGLDQESGGQAFKLFAFPHNNANDNWLDDVYVSSDDMDTIARARAFTRPAFSIVYWLMAASIVWVFYTRVFEYIWRAIGWILEYTNSLFDS